MILAAAVMLFQMQALPSKPVAAVATRPEAVTYAENIPAPFAEDGVHYLNLADRDGTKNKPKVTPASPAANTRILSRVYIPNHFEALPPLPNKHYEVVRSGAHKRLGVAIAQSSAATFNRARRRLKLGRSTEAPTARSLERDSLGTRGQIPLASEPNP